MNLEKAKEVMKEMRENVYKIREYNLHIYKFRKYPKANIRLVAEVFMQATVDNVIEICKKHNLLYWFGNIKYYTTAKLHGIVMNIHS